MSLLDGVARGAVVRGGRPRWARCGCLSGGRPYVGSGWWAASTVLSVARSSEGGRPVWAWWSVPVRGGGRRSGVVGEHDGGAVRGAVVGTGFLTRLPAGAVRGAAVRGEWLASLLIGSARGASGRTVVAAAARRNALPRRRACSRGASRHRGVADRDHTSPGSEGPMGSEPARSGVSGVVRRTLLAWRQVVVTRDVRAMTQDLPGHRAPGGSSRGASRHRRGRDVALSSRLRLRLATAGRSARLAQRMVCRARRRRRSRCLR